MSKLKVLVVDDEPGIRSGIRRILQNHSISLPFLDDDFSFELSEAKTGEEALELLHTNRIDIVLLDNKLPGIQGIEVLAYIKKNKIDTQVLMITSFASLDLAVTATQQGAYDFIPKPFTPAELKTAIDSVSKHLFLKRMTRKMKKTGKKLRFQFLSVLSHELKSPINAIEGYLNLMQEADDKNKIGDYKPMIDRSLARLDGMRTLIMDLLDLTRAQTKTSKTETRRTDFSVLAQSALDSVQPYAIQREVSLHCDKQNLPELVVNASEMEIILNNLLSNAVKYNVSGGKVFLRISTHADQLIINVKDTGIGIAPEHLENLYKDFYRIKNPKTRQVQGSGLGLSIVKQIVEKYNGNIDVKSEPDKGSEFTVKMPLAILREGEA